MSFLNLRPTTRRGPGYVKTDECAASVRHVLSKNRGPTLMLYVGWALWSGHAMASLRRVSVRMGADEDFGLVQIVRGEDFPVTKVGNPTNHVAVAVPLNRMVGVRDRDGRLHHICVDRPMMMTKAGLGRNSQDGAVQVRLPEEFWEPVGTEMPAFNARLFRERRLARAS